MSFRKNLEHLRKGKNLSQEDLAFKLGVSRQAVSKWESGGTYPETSKMLVLCKLFECSLDELMHEDIAEIQKEATKKYSIEDLIGEITRLIKRTSTMISQMTLASLIKFGFELFILFLIMLILKVPFDHAYNLGEGIFINFGAKVAPLLSSIWRLTIEGVYFIAATILFVYIYKIRFLDKFDATEIQPEILDVEPKSDKGNNVVESTAKVVEKPTKLNTPTDFGLFALLGKFAILSVKAFVILMFPLLVMAFIGSIVGLVIGIALVFSEVVYIGALLFTVAFACFSALMIYVSYNFVLDRRLDWEKAFIAFLTSIIGLGVSIGIGTIELNQLTITTQDRSDTTRELLVKEFDMQDDLVISQFWYNSEFVADESLTDTIRVEVSYNNEFAQATIEQDENQIYATVFSDSVSVSKLYELLLNDLKNGTIYVNDSAIFDGKIKFYTSAENIKILEENVIELQTVYEDPYDECECDDGATINDIDEGEVNIIE